MDLHAAAIFVRLLHRHICQQHSVDAGCCRCFTEALQAHAQNRIEVGKNHQPYLRVLAHVAGQLKYVGQRGTVVESTLAGALNYRPICNGITKWHSQLDYIGSRSGRRQNDLPCRGQIGIAAG